MCLFFFNSTQLYWVKSEVYMVATQNILIGNIHPTKVGAYPICFHEYYQLCSEGGVVNMCTCKYFVLNYILW